MARLNQILAIEKGIKSEAYSAVTELDKAAKKPDLFNGFTKKYAKLSEDSEDLPPESKRVQVNANECLTLASKFLTNLMGIVARKDWTNCKASADIALPNGATIANVPVTYLLFLEKQLTDVRTFINDLPVLDVAEEWTQDPNSSLYRTDITRTHRTKKVQRPITLVPPTVEHPGQAQLITEDVLVGHWEQTKLSGALPKPRKDVLLERVDSLLQVIKLAREAANSIEEVETPYVGSVIFGYLLAE